MIKDLVITAEQIEEDIANKRILILRSVWGKGKGPSKLRPAMDRDTGQLMTGQGTLTEEEKRKVRVVITADTNRVVEDDTVLDLNNEVNQIHWRWMGLTGLIAPSYEVATSKRYPNVQFYIQNDEADRDKKIKQRTLRLQAQNLVAEASYATLIKVGYLMGENSESFSELGLIDLLQERCETKEGATRIIKVFDELKPGGEGQVKLLFKRLKDARIIVESNGVFRHGNQTLGISPEQCIEFMKSEENAGLLRSMYSRLEPTKLEKSQALQDIEREQQERERQEEQQRLYQQVNEKEAMLREKDRELEALRRQMQQSQYPETFAEEVVDLGDNEFEDDEDDTRDIPDELLSTLPTTEKPGNRPRRKPKPTNTIPPAS